MDCESAKKNGKTWFIDIDGVIFEHNGYLYSKESNHEIPLPGVLSFFQSLDCNDKVILCTARKESFRQNTEASLLATGIRYDLLLMNLPTGKRIIINDKKDDGMQTAFAVNVKRNSGIKKSIKRLIE